MRSDGMHDLALPPPVQTRRVSPAGPSPINGGNGRPTGRETSRISAPVTLNARAAATPISPPPEGAPTSSNREAAAMMTEQRRLRRQLEASLRDQLARRPCDDGGHHRLPALRTALGRSCLPVDAAHRNPTRRTTGAARPSCPRPWRNITRSWATPLARRRMNGRAPAWSRSSKRRARCRIRRPLSTRPRKVSRIPRRIRVTSGSRCAAVPGTWLAVDPGTLRHGGRPGIALVGFRPRIARRYGLRSSGCLWRIILLSAQSAERASYLTNMLNSLDVAVMVIEQPPAPVPAVVSLVNRSFCELFRGGARPGGG